MHFKPRLFLFVFFVRSFFLSGCFPLLFLLLFFLRGVFGCILSLRRQETQEAIAYHNECPESKTQWTYEQLADFSYSYGSNEGNGYEATGCLSVLIIGTLLLLYSVIHLWYITAAESKLAEQQSPKYEALPQDDALDESAVQP